MIFARAFLVTLAAAALAAALSPRAATASTNDASAIIARHQAYTGGPEGLVLTYRFKRSTKAAALAPTPKPSAGPTFPPTTITTYRRGALYREVQEYSGVTSQRGFTGRAFWSANMNGYTVINYENAARFALTRNVIAANLIDPNVVATSHGTQKVDGVEADVVRIVPAGGMPADVAFDQKTGAYVQVTYDPESKYDRDRYVLHYDGYTEVAPGIRVPAATTTAPASTAVSRSSRKPRAR